MKAVISYIIKFLIGGDQAGGLSSLIGYTSDPLQFSNYKIVILPSPFFQDNVYGKTDSLPELPLAEIEGIPLLFGTPETEWYGDIKIVHADIIASAYFLLTRYEEIRCRNERDKHGRFPGKQSLPYRAGFIHRPIVDEYGKLLRSWLRGTEVKVEEPKAAIRKVWLTHDIDAPFFCRTLRSLVRETIKGAGFINAWKYYTGMLESDPYYTFTWLTEQNNSLINTLGREICESVFFFKPGGKSLQDKPHYKITGKDMHELFLTCKSEHISIGLHSSYDAGRVPFQITSEQKALEKAVGQKVCFNRHHYLASREPEDMDWLEKSGITDDFTMGYADIAGFRLGTSRPVHWINPVNKRISSLLLHPLTVMDCTLSEPAYMALPYNEALTYCLQLIDQVKQSNGELILLWHNDTLATEKNKPVSVDWHRKLYVQLIEELKLSV